jgi:hypothetical protein
MNRRVSSEMNTVAAPTPHPATTQVYRALEKKFNRIKDHPLWSITQPQFVALCAYLCALLRRGYNLHSRELDVFVAKHESWRRIRRKHPSVGSYPEWFQSHQRSPDNPFAQKPVLNEKKLYDTWKENCHVFSCTEMGSELAMHQVRHLPQSPPGPGSPVVVKASDELTVLSNMCLQIDEGGRLLDANDQPIHEIRACAPLAPGAEQHCDIDEDTGVWMEEFLVMARAAGVPGAVRYTQMARLVFPAPPPRYPAWLTSRQRPPYTAAVYKRWAAQVGPGYRHRHPHSYIDRQRFPNLDRPGDHIVVVANPLRPWRCSATRPSLDLTCAQVRDDVQVTLLARLDLHDEAQLKDVLQSPWFQNAYRELRQGSAKDFCTLETPHHVYGCLLGLESQSWKIHRAVDGIVTSSPATFGEGISQTDWTLDCYHLRFLLRVFLEASWRLWGWDNDRHCWAKLDRGELVDQCTRAFWLLHFVRWAHKPLVGETNDFTRAHQDKMRYLQNMAQAISDDVCEPPPETLWTLFQSRSSAAETQGTIHPGGDDDEGHEGDSPWDDIPGPVNERQRDHGQPPKPVLSQSVSSTTLQAPNARGENCAGDLAFFRNADLATQIATYLGALD